MLSLGSFPRDCELDSADSGSIYTEQLSTPVTTSTAPHTNSVSRSLEDSMITVTPPVSSPAYDLGRPAALWLAALAPQQAAYKSPGCRAQLGSPIRSRW